MCKESTAKPRVIVLPDLHPPCNADLDWAIRQFCDEKFHAQLIEHPFTGAPLFIRAESNKNLFAQRMKRKHVSAPRSSGG